HDSAQLAIGMMLLGLGWSGTMVAGSIMLSESVPLELRAAAQGLSDLIMGLAGALAGAISGLILEGWGYPRLTLLAALATAPLLLILWSSVKVRDEVKISA
ncbi:MAG TPA: MFS transporter, partial [Gemmatimonadales bacterium]|nr:MFS transporter [Gemmatimonadales bacterium]